MELSSGQLLSPLFLDFTRRTGWNATRGVTRRENLNVNSRFPDRIVCKSSLQDLCVQVVTDEISNGNVRVLTLSDGEYLISAKIWNTSIGTLKDRVVVLHEFYISATWSPKYWSFKGKQRQFSLEIHRLSVHQPAEPLTFRLAPVHDHANVRSFLKEFHDWRELSINSAIRPTTDLPLLQAGTMASQGIPTQLPFATQAPISSQPTQEDALLASQLSIPQDSLRKSSQDVKPSASKPAMPESKRKQKRQPVPFPQPDVSERWEELCSRPGNGHSSRDTDMPDAQKATMRWFEPGTDWSKVGPIMPRKDWEGMIERSSEDEDDEDENENDSIGGAEDGHIDLTQSNEIHGDEADENQPDVEMNLIEQAKERRASESPDSSPLPWPASDPVAPAVDVQFSDAQVQEQETSGDIDMEDASIDGRSSDLPPDSDIEREGEPKSTEWLNTTSPAPEPRPNRSHISPQAQSNVQVMGTDAVTSSEPDKGSGKKVEFVEIDSGEEESSSAEGAMSPASPNLQNALGGLISESELPDNEDDLQHMLQAETRNSPLRALIYRKLRTVTTRNSRLEQVNPSPPEICQDSNLEMVPGTFEDRAKNAEAQQSVKKAARAKAAESRSTSPSSPSSIPPDCRSNIGDQSSSAHPRPRVSSQKASHNRSSSNTIPAQAPRSRKASKSGMSQVRRTDSPGEVSDEIITQPGHQKRKTATEDAKGPTPKRPKAWKVQFESSSPYEMSQSLQQYAGSQYEVDNLRREHFSRGAPIRQKDQQPQIELKDDRTHLDKEEQASHRPMTESPVLQHRDGPSRMEAYTPSHPADKTTPVSEKSRASTSRRSISLPLTVSLSGAALDLFQHFKETYPSWIGNEKDFVLRCQGLTATTIPLFLYDDYVIRFSSEYRAYIFECAESGQGSRAYTDWFVDEVGGAEYAARVLNRDVVSNFLTSLDNDSSAVGISTPQAAPSRRDSIPEQDKPKLLSSRSAPAKDSMMPAPQTPVRSEIPSSEQPSSARRRSLPWHRTGDSGAPIQIDDDDLTIVERSIKQHGSSTTSAAKAGKTPTTTPTSTEPTKSPDLTRSAAAKKTGRQSTGTIKPLPKRIIRTGYQEPVNTFAKFTKSRKSVGG